MEVVAGLLEVVVELMEMKAGFLEVVAEHLDRDLVAGSYGASEEQCSGFLTEIEAQFHFP